VLWLIYVTYKTKAVQTDILAQRWLTCIRPAIDIIASSFPKCSLYPYINSQREHMYLVNVYAIITIWLLAFNLPQSRQKRREL